jgi:hypothetical protein
MTEKNAAAYRSIAKELVITPANDLPMPAKDFICTLDVVMRPRQLSYQWCDFLISLVSCPNLTAR